jgi:UDP-2,3-diacylglucosamine pyrophosphatase LpxH
MPPYEYTPDDLMDRFGAVLGALYLGSDIGAIVFGHTHCPDTATVEWQPGVTYTYYNTGSWVETEPCMLYLVIGDDGIMQGRCFRVRDRQHLGVGECGPGNCTYQGKH